MKKQKITAKAISLFLAFLLAAGLNCMPERKYGKSECRHRKSAGR